MDVNVTEIHGAMQIEGWLIQKRQLDILLVDSQEVQQAICSIEIGLFNELEKSLIKRIGTITKAAGIYDVYIPVDVFEVEAVDEEEELEGKEEEQGGEEVEEAEKDSEKELTDEDKVSELLRAEE